MEPDRRERVQTIALEALGCADDERAAYLEAACRGDGALRRDVDSLLAGHVQAAALFESPPWASPASPLVRGTRLGPYEIDASIGAGGMGEVYKATDTRLGRAVAIKVLPTGMADDPERRARFQREARTIAGLSHPHICSLFDVGDHDGATFLVMEYLTGGTLAERLKQGRLPLDQALRVGTEIADALSAAHRQGITHRDLKPANVVLTRSGAKLLDFGLAKLTAHASSPALTPPLPASSNSFPLTGEGRIIGTLPYMAPEQFKGAEAGARADIWACGCVLYEMLTGRRPFEGASAAEVIGAILRDEPPPVSSILPGVPPHLDRVVQTSLAKDPDDRWQDAQDLQKELRWLSEIAVAAVPATRARTRLPKAGWRAALVVTSVLAGAVIASAWWLLRAVPPVNVHAAIPMPPGTELLVRSFRRPIAISPDGRTLLYVASTNGVRQIFTRPIDGLEATVISGTDNSSSPFFSPDGSWIGFFSATDMRMKKVAVSGGAPVVICETVDVRGASWGSDNWIVYSPRQDGGLLRVSASGGRPEALTTLDAQARERTHRYPDLLPNGKGVIFTIGTQDIASFSDARIAVYDFASRSTRILIDGGLDARYVAPGYLLYGRDGALMAVRFDADRLRVSGTPIRVLDSVMTSSEYGWAAVAASRTGVLAYVQGRDPRRTRDALWMDRAGRTTPAGNPGNVTGVRLSPDASRAAYILGGANDSLWVYDLHRPDLFRRLTVRGSVAAAEWTPDGQRLVYFNGTEFGSVPADGSREGQTIRPERFASRPGTITPDGRTLIYSTDRPGTSWDIWALDMATLSSRSILSTQASERAARISPDGRWMAYESRDGERYDVHVRSFPGGGRHYQVSAGGGYRPLWSRDGRELYFGLGDGLYVARVRASGVELDVSPPQRVPVPPRILPPVGFWNTYDIAPDGRLLLIQDNTPPSSATVNIVAGWFDELARRMETGK